MPFQVFVNGHAKAQDDSNRQAKDGSDGIERTKCEAQKRHGSPAVDCASDGLGSLLEILLSRTHPRL